MRAVDKVKESVQFIPEGGKSVVRVKCVVTQSFDKTSERKLVEITAIGSRPVRLYWQQSTAFRVQDKQQSVEESERVAVDVRKVGLAQMVIPKIHECRAGIFEYAEDAPAQVRLQVSLETERLLPHAVEKA